MYGQGIITGSISGSVADPTGAVITNATVTAVSDSTGISLVAKSNAEGSFLITHVPIGTYTLTIVATGFSGDKVTGVQVVAGNTTSIGAQAMGLGSAAQSIQVEAGAAALLNTESAQGEVVLDSQQLSTMPVNGGFDSVTLVVPGIVATHSDGFSNTNGVNFSANGQRGRSNNFEIDGQSNNDNSVTGPQVFFSNQDAIGEIEVISNNFSAQYGRNMGAVVNYVTKNGTNRFHGSAFELYEGSWGSSLTQGEKDPQFGYCPSGSSPAYAAANGCSLISITRFVQNNYGGTIGGPILKDKLFFFGSTYFDRTYEGAYNFTSGGNTFPDATGLKQLQADFPGNSGVAAMVQNGPYAYPTGNPNPFGATSLLPVTDGNTIQNIEVSQYQRGVPNYVHDQEDLGRLDYQATPKDRFYVRYLYQKNPTVPAGGNFAAGGYYDVLAATHSVGADWSHIFASNIVSQLRYSFQQATLAFDGGGIPGCTIASFAACPSQVSLGTGLEGFGYASNLPQGRVVKVTQIQNNTSWTHGRQTILLGGEFDYQNSPNVYLPNAIGAFNFAPGATSTPFRNVSSNSNLSNGITGMLEGITQTGLTAGSPTTHFTEPDYSFYFQDDWKVLQNLTLNLGVRYEFFSQSINLLHNESVAQQTGPDPFWNTSLPLSATTFPKIDSFYKNIEPRIGLVWSPATNKKLVVHAGFAINVDPAFDNIFINIATGTPVTNAGSFACDGITVQCVPGNGLTYSTVQAADAQFIPTGGDPRANPYQNVPTNFRNPMAESYTLGVQYALGGASVLEVRYVGNHTFHQFQSLNGNPDVADVQTYFPNYGAGTTVCTTAGTFGITRPNCDYGLVETTANTAFAIYNGLQTSYTVHNFHHWTGVFSYTYSRAIDNVSEIFSTGSGGTTSAYAQNPLDPNVAERGVSGNSYPSVIGAQMSYTAPWFKEQHGIMGRILGGYAFNAFYTYNGGQPFNPTQAVAAQSPFVNANDPLASTSFCDISFSQVFGNPCRPILSNAKAPIGSVGINTGAGGYINYVTGASISPTDVHWLWNNQYEAIARNNPFPGVGRNILRGDSYNNLDLTVSKNLKLTEHITTILQISAFNSLNRGYYGTPDPSIEDSLYPTLYGSPAGFLSNYYSGGGGESPSAGGAFGNAPGNRNIQLGGKIVF
jgi:Carboxypeptidase regulatory-like domain/TonB-dependent Receptor Plug Domain/TonB dependent receptor